MLITRALELQHHWLKGGKERGGPQSGACSVSTEIQNKEKNSYTRKLGSQFTVPLNLRGLHARLERKERRPLISHSVGQIGLILLLVQAFGQLHSTIKWSVVWHFAFWVPRILAFHDSPTE